MAKLELKKLNIMYGDFHAVKDVDINIYDSEIATLLGPSGCGKTSILRAIAGFVKPSAGEIFLNDEDITDSPPQSRDMGMIFQNYALWPHMKVSENVGYGLKLRGVEKETREKRVRELLDQVQLGDQYDKVPSQLSGGQQQRVALARALAVDPKVLLCDEPLSNLDFKLRVELRKEIRDIAKNFDVTVIYVTHDQTEALAISDKIAVIDHGVVIQEGSPIEIFNDPNTHFVGRFVGENNLLSGKIVSKSNGTVEIKLGSGDPLFVHNIGQEVKKDTDVDLIVRHDKIDLAASSSDKSLAGVIKHNAFMGDFVQLEFELGDGSSISGNITENIFEVSSYEQGRKVNFTVDSNSVFLFDKDGKRIK